MPERAPGTGYSVFADTMADMTYLELEQCVKDGAVALWALGVIEQHGPHLPLATDIYVPAATLSEARRMLAARGIASVTVPPFYWGVNVASASFAGSFEVRPEVMVELMKDVFANLKKDGFTQVFCLSGHGEALHNQTILAGVKAGCAAAGIDGSVIIAPAMAQRLGFDLADPHLAVMEPESAGASPGAEPQPYLDIHAGEWETSVIWGLFPDVVRTSIVPTLEPTNYGPADLAEWRKGYEHSRRKTPRGYFGSPAAADPARGAAIIAGEARRVADAIASKVQRFNAPK
jgi:creatinine amidohydrolase